MSLEPSFPKEEFELRYKKARRLMAEKSLDALMATDVTNYVYLGGHPSALTRRMGASRPQLLIFPKEGEPVLIAQMLFEKIMQETCWIENFQLWQEFPFTIRHVQKVLEELKLTGKRIGVDLGAEYRLEVSYDDFLNLQKNLPKASFVDATEVFLKLRLPKTNAEIECLRKACDITGKAYERLFDTLKPGITEKEIANLMITFMKEEGSEKECWTHPRIFPGAVVMRGPTDRALKKGDHLFIDSGATIKGYRADFSRLAIVGEPSKKLKEMYELCESITWKEVEATKPGIKASDIAELGSIELEKYSIRAKPAGRDGHGLGLGGLELPSISLEDDTLLERGMVVTYEPEVSSITIRPELAAQLPEFRFVQEENVLVTKNGFEVFSTSSRGLHPI